MSLRAAERSATMQHVSPIAVRYFETLNGAQLLYMNSMRIALDPLAPAVAAATQDAMRVELRIDFSSWTTAQHTLAVHVAPDCVKTFVFERGCQAVGIPCSTSRDTSVEITCFNDGQKVDAGTARSFVLDMQQSKSTALSGPVTIGGSPDVYQFYTALKHGANTANYMFKCFAYAPDARASTGSAFEYSISNAFRDFDAVLARPLITPSRQVSIVSASQAEARLAELEDSLQQLHAVFDSIFADTARMELGATDENAEDVASTVDWARSHAVSGDAAVQALIAGTCDLYTRLSLLSNTAVDDSWLQDDAVREMIQARQRLTESVRGRRTELAQVTRVRSSFLCIDAIDNALRRVVSNEHERPAAIATALEMQCHRYWLEQMKANTHNAVSLAPETVGEAVKVLDGCSRLCDGRRLLPPTNVVASALGYKLWQSMHLQGLAQAHALPVAPCAHFMYKKRARVDYEIHPVVTEAALRPLAQLEPLALLTMLVSTDVEHRIIPPRLGEHVLELLRRASAPDAAEPTRLEAAAFLTRVLDPQLHSLAASALGFAEQPDLSFITAAGSRPGITGYNMPEVTAFCLQDVIKLAGGNAV